MVYFNNEYQLPQRFEADDIIIDVGAHIGSFAFASLVRGATHVISIEAHPDNFHRAQQHLADYIGDGRLNLQWGAVWRSDDHHNSLYYGDIPMIADGLSNTGNVEVHIHHKGQSTPALALDNLIAHHRIRLLKLDCEGSEFPILLTSKRLRQVDEIVGEFHEFGGEFDQCASNFQLPNYDSYTIDLLLAHLQSQGFTTEYRRHERYADGDWIPLRLGYFRAKRFDSA
jgi:FkbM family methyltransferase